MSKNEYAVEDVIESLRICSGEGDGCEGCHYHDSGVECFNCNKLLIEAADTLEELRNEIQSK